MLKNEIYRAAYDFHEKWAPFPQTADNWLPAATEMRNLASIHNDKLLDSFLIAIFNDFEREYRKSPQQKD